MILARICPLVFCASLALALGPRAPRIRPEDIVTYKPPISEQLNGTAFSGWIKTQISQGHKILGLAEGAYNVIPGSDPAHIYLANLDSFTLWMDSVNLTMTKVGLGAFNFYRCSDVITYGPTVWWDTPGFSQATITNVNNLGDETYDIHIHLDDGYDPSFLINNSTGLLNGEYTDPKTGRLQAGPGWSTISGSATPVEAHKDTYSVMLKNSYFQPLEGYKILARGDFIFCNQVTESNNTIINHFTLLNCAGFGFFSGSNRRTTFNSFSLKPAPFPPPNGKELPARSSSADGIHSAGDYVGPTFDSCFFSALDDDCIAIHGSLYQMTGRGPSLNSFLAPSGLAEPGDVLRFYANGTYSVLGTATVTSASTSASPLSITVDHMPSEVDAVTSTARWTNQNRVGSGFKITNTHTTGNRGRGAIIKASNGIIANNIFEGVSYAALNLGPEFSSWDEADYVHNISIINNTLRDCNYISKAGAAFQLHGDGVNDVHGNSNITISGLVIQNTTASNLYVGASEGLKLGNLKLDDVFAENYTLWETWPGSVITVENARFESVKGSHCVVGGIGRTGVNMSNLIGTVEGFHKNLVTSC